MGQLSLCRQRRFRRLAAVGVLVVGTGVSAAHASAGTTEPDGTGSSEAWDEVVAAAQEEGSVVVYGAKGPPIPQLVTEGFEDAYGISVEYIEISSGDMVERVDQELEADQLGADVLLNSEILWQADLAAAGELVSPDLFGPSKDLWEEQYYADGMVQIAADPTGIIYNTDLVDTVPTDWDSLIDPQYTGRVGVLDASIATALTMYYRMLIDTMGEDYLEDLAALEPQIHGGSSTLSQAVAAGELAWAPFGNAYTTIPLQDEGAPIALAFPESGTSMVLMNAVAMTRASHPNAALLLMDWMMSVEGQTAINGNGKGLSPIDVEGSLDLGGLDRESIRTITADDALPENRDAINELFDRLFRQ